MPTNFGILQPAQANTQTQVIQTPDTGAQDTQQLLQGIQQGAALSNQSQQMGLAQQDAARQQALLPGQLAQQQATLAGTGAATENAKMQNKILETQMQSGQAALQQRQARMQAYEEGKKTGGSSDAGLDAVQDMFYQQGDTKAGLEMADTRQKLKDNIASGNRKGIVGIASTIMGTMQDAADGKTTPLNVYTQRYDTIKKLYPDAPKPETFKGDNNLYEDSFVHPVLDTSKDYIAQGKTEHDALVQQDLYKAQSNFKDKTSDLKRIINTYGATSTEAKDAANMVNDARAQIQDIAKTKGNYFTNLMKGDDTSKTINRYKDTTPKLPSVTAKAPAVTMPTMNSKADFQAWFTSQPTEIQSDIKTNPAKYGIK